MPAPGWNVTEPIALAYRLYRIAQQLQYAPESAKDFKSKIEDFGASLKALQDVLEKVDGDEQPILAANGLAQLRKEVVDSQKCIERCEEFITKFGGITSDGSKTAAGAGSARWVWKKDRAEKLTEQIESHIRHIGLSLQINTFAQAHSPKASFPRSPPDGPLRTPSLPPYSSPRSMGQQVSNHQAATPSSILRIQLPPELRTKSRDLSTTMDYPWLAENALISTASRDFSNQGPSGLDGGLSPLGDRPNTEVGPIASSKSSPEMCTTYSTVFSASVGEPSQSPFTSPELERTQDSRRTRQGSYEPTDEVLIEGTLQDLQGASITLRRGNDRFKQPIECIEAFQRPHSKQRYITFTPPEGSNIKYYLNCSADRAVIPHVEHPCTSESKAKYQVKLEKTEFNSERVRRRQSSSASPNYAPNEIPAPSSASVRSISSLSSSADSARFTREHHRQVLTFRTNDDSKKFQEMVLGPGVELQAQIPAWTITSKRFEENDAVTESKLQCLRLWRRGRCQHLLYFANVSSQNFHEFCMSYFVPKEMKTKNSIRLELDLPGQIRRRGSKSKSPTLTQNDQEPTNSDIGLTKPIDLEALREIDYLSIEFEDRKAKADFLRKANFHGFVDDPILPELTLALGSLDT